jgi:hypothetical protein
MLVEEARQTREGAADAQPDAGDRTPGAADAAQ